MTAKHRPRYAEALMPDTVAAGFSRTCPSCGRSVPRTVTTCRCGVTLPAAPELDQVVEADGEAPMSNLRATLVGVGGIALIVGLGWFWFTQTPPAARGVTQPSAASATMPQNSQTPEPAPATTTRTAAEREWETAVSLAASKETGPTPAATPPPVAISLPAPPTATLSTEDIVSRAMPAVVLVETPTSRGSGFFVMPDTILTNVHVVENNNTVTLRRGDGTSVMARVDSRAPSYDIAVLKVVSAVPGQAVIPLGNAAALRQGQDLIVIGSPMGLLQNTVTRGIVSALRQSGQTTLVQTDAAVNPGNSGGPVLDRTGAAIGITTLSFRQSQGLNFAVSIDHARAILEGRAPTSSTAMTNAVAEIKNFSPTVGSEADRARAEGLRAFEGAMDSLASSAADFDSAWQRFKDQCYSGAIRGAFDREWFAVLVPGAIAGTISAQCGPNFDSFKKDAQRFEAQMRSAHDAARRAGVYPGDIREARRSRRVDFGGWDR